MSRSRLARASRIAVLTVASSCSMSCALLFDMELGTLSDDDGGGAGGAGRDASFDGTSTKGDAGVPDGSDVRTDGDRSDAHSDRSVDGTPTDTNGDAPRADVTPADTVVDGPRADVGFDVTPPSDTSIDSTVPPSDVVTVDVSVDTPRDATVDPTVDTSRDTVADTSRDAIVDTRPPDATGDPAIPCSPSTCPSGCCSNDICVPYASQNNNTCGVGGADCAPCPANNTCSQSSNGCQFQCSPTSCPSGCCNNNVCVPYASQDNNTCGVGGNMCAPCPSGRICAQSSAGCMTWCGLRSAPAGVGTGDYACVDFETGMPPANVWVPSIQEMSTVQLTNVALSVPNGLESVCVATQTFGNEALLRWTTAPTTTKLKKVSVSAAVNPGLFQRLDTDYQVLCANISAGFPSSACLVFSSSQGLVLRWRFYNGSGYVSGECAANGSLANEQWTNAEVHLDPVTGLTQAVIGGAITNCQATDVPLEDTVGFAELGLSRNGPATIGLTMRYDNVEVAVRR